MFGKQDGHPVAGHRPRSFLSTLAIGVSFVLVAIIGSATTVGLYGLSIVDRKAGNIFELAETTLSGMPELIASLPPVLADLIDDERRPDYAGQIDVSVKLGRAYNGRGMKPIVRVRNLGDEVVSLISMRLVVSDERGDPICERNAWAATPIAADDEWRGPLLPGTTRSFAADGWFTGKERASEDLTLSYEITDIRVWHGDGESVELTSAR